MPSNDRETVEVPADDRRSAWGLFLAALGAVFVAGATAMAGLTQPVTYATGGGLLVGLGLGLTDHVVEREQRRLSSRLRDWLHNRDARA